MKTLLTKIPFEELTPVGFVISMVVIHFPVERERTWCCVPGDDHISRTKKEHLVRDNPQYNTFTSFARKQQPG